MAYVNANPNPLNIEVGDCTVRAISLASGESWERVYLELCVQGLLMADMPSSNVVWGVYLADKGYKYHAVSELCPFSYTIEAFCKDHSKGTYIVGTGTHVVCVRDGDYYDSWDSGAKSPIYYFTRERD